MAPVCVVNELNLNPHPLHTTETQRMGHPAVPGKWAALCCPSLMFPSIRLVLYSSNWGVSDRRSDRKSTRLNSSHLGISYAVFCLKKKKTAAEEEPVKEAVE